MVSFVSILLKLPLDKEAQFRYKFLELQLLVSQNRITRCNGYIAVWSMDKTDHTTHPNPDYSRRWAEGILSSR